MITYIKAKNFKSLKNIVLDLNKTKDKTNKFVAIYGENGSGKTNIVELFKFIQQLTMSKIMDIQLRKYKELFEIQQKIEKISFQFKQLMQLSIDLNEYRMLGDENDTEIEYGFKIKNIDGFYYIKFNNEIIEEKLYYMGNKQKTFFFQLEKKENTIKKILNKNIFVNDRYRNEIIDNIDKYWGKYSLLSLLTLEMIEKNENYIFENISKKIYSVINEFLLMPIHVNKWGNNIIPDTFITDNSLIDLKEGIIKKDDKCILKKYEDILNIFFTQAYADIKGVAYKTEENENGIHYELYFEKMIGGMLKSIPSSLESQGTKRILDEFNNLIGALQGKTVVIDEIDNGIHDLLMKNIIMSIKDEITGQLIITTHNTLLLEILPKEKIYILSTDYKGNKKISSIKDYDINIQKNHNLRDLYFKGVFGGIPMTSYVDFEEIRYAFEDAEK